MIFVKHDNVARWVVNVLAMRKEKMDLTPENKAHIDRMSYFGLLERWRYAQSGDPWFQGETGAYWGARMKEIREQSVDHGVAASKALG